MNLVNMLVTCNNYEIDPILPAVTSSLVTIIKIGIPLILIFLGMLDLGKAVMANDEKVMKEAQSRLIKRFVYAIVVFLLVAIVQMVFNMIGSAATSSGSEDDAEKGNISNCIDLFINGNK